MTQLMEILMNPFSCDFCDLFSPWLCRYEGIFSPKSRAKTMQEHEAKLMDGCAIFYRFFDCKCIVIHDTLAMWDKVWVTIVCPQDLKVSVRQKAAVWVQPVGKQACQWSRGHAQQVLIKVANHANIFISCAEWWQKTTLHWQRCFGQKRLAGKVECPGNTRFCAFRS